MHSYEKIVNRATLDTIGKLLLRDTWLEMEIESGDPQAGRSSVSSRITRSGVDHQQYSGWNSYKSVIYCTDLIVMSVKAIRLAT